MMKQPRIEEQDEKEIQGACTAYLQGAAAAKSSLQQAAKKMDEKATKMQEEARKIAARQKQQQLEDPTYGFGKVATRSGKRQPQPLTHVMRDRPGPKGEPTGTYATSVNEVDGILRRASRRIYQSNLADQHMAAAVFMAK